MKGSNHNRKRIFNKTFWDSVFAKLRKLGTQIEMKLGPSMNIDDVDYRWVNDRIEYYDKDDRILDKEEMHTANSLYRKFS